MSFSPLFFTWSWIFKLTNKHFRNWIEVHWYVNSLPPLYEAVLSLYFLAWEKSIVFTPESVSTNTRLSQNPSQEKKGGGEKEVNAENKCHMSERVNLIWSEVKFDAIYSESCVCSISVLPCHIGYLRLSVPCASLCSFSLPVKHSHTHTL